VTGRAASEPYGGAPPAPLGGHVGALLLPVATVMLVLGGVSTPHGMDRPITGEAEALRQMQVAAVHTGAVWVSSPLVILGLGALAGAFLALASLSRADQARLAVLGAWAGAVGAFCGAVVNVLLRIDLAAAATRPSSTVAAHVLVEANTGAVVLVLFVGYFGGLVAGTVLTAVALWRSRTTPRWLPPLFVSGLVLAAAAPPGLVALPMSALFVMAVAALTRLLWLAPGAGPVVARTGGDRVPA
jgi:hypothetical protein